MKDINSLIAQLVQYGKEKGLVAKEDEIYTINRLLEILHLDEYKETVCEEEMKLEDILAQIMDWAYENGVMQENSVVYRDLFDTKLMGALVPAPSVVIKKFRELYKESPKKATDFIMTSVAIQIISAVTVLQKTVSGKPRQSMAL